MRALSLCMLLTISLWVVINGWLICCRNPISPSSQPCSGQAIPVLHPIPWNRVDWYGFFITRCTIDIAHGRRLAPACLDFIIGYLLCYVFIRQPSSIQEKDQLSFGQIWVHAARVYSNIQNLFCQAVLQNKIASVVHNCVIHP